MAAQLIKYKVKLQKFIFSKMMSNKLARGFTGWREVWLASNSKLAEAEVAKLIAERQKRKEERVAAKAAEAAALRSISMGGDPKPGAAACCIVS